MSVCFAIELNSDTFYDFSDEAQAQFDAEINKTETLKEETPKLEKTKTNKKQQAQPTQKQEIKTTTQNINTTNDDYIVIKNGESLYATLQSSISSASIDKNDTIAATLEQDWKYKGKFKKSYWWNARKKESFNS